MSIKRIPPSVLVSCLLACNLILSGCRPAPSSDLTGTPAAAASSTQASTPAGTQSATQPVLSNLPIRAENLDQVRLIASIPEAPERMYRFSSDARLLFVADTHAIDVFDLETNTLGKHFPFGVTYNSSSNELDPSGMNEGHFSISASGNVFAFIDFEGVKVFSLEGEMLFSSPLEMPFAPGLSPRLLTASFGLALSPDGEYLALSGSPNGIDVIRLSDGQTIAAPDLVGRYPRFSPDGQTLVTMSDSSLSFWDTTSWTAVQTIPYRGYWPLFTFLNDSTILLHNWSNSLELWDLSHRERIRSIQLEGDPRMSIVLAQPLVSPSGQFLAVMKRDAEVPCFEPSPITVTVFNLDGELLSEQASPFESRNCKPYFLGLGYLSAPIFLLDSGVAMSASPASNENLWDPHILQAAESTAAPAGLPAVVESYLQQQWSDFKYVFELSPDGRYAALALRKDTGSAMVIYDVLQDDPLYWGSAAFTSGSFSPDGSLFAMSLGNTIHTIDLSLGQDLKFMPLYTDPRLVSDAPLVISPDGSILAAVIARDALGETLGFISLNDGALLYQWPVGNDEISGLGFSEDGNYLIAATFGGWTDILGIAP